MENQKHAFFDEGPEEPSLCTYIGFSDCQNCYFRLSTVERITKNVEALDLSREPESWQEEQAERRV